VSGLNFVRFGNHEAEANMQLLLQQREPGLLRKFARTKSLLRIQNPKERMKLLSILMGQKGSTQAERIKESN
jgi:hypothetical protein